MQPPRLPPKWSEFEILKRGPRKLFLTSCLPDSVTCECGAASYSCADCSPSKDSWLRGQVGADTQLVPCWPSHVPCLKAELAWRGCLVLIIPTGPRVWAGLRRQLYPIIHSLVHWFSSCFQPSQQALRKAGNKFCR